MGDGDGEQDGRIWGGMMLVVMINYNKLSKEKKKQNKVAKHIYVIRKRLMQRMQRENQGIGISAR